MSPQRSLCVLGSTGSIGTQTLDVVRAYPDRFRVVGLSAFGNAELLIAQAQEFNPRVVAVANELQFSRVQEALAGSGISVVSGSDGLVELVDATRADLVVAAIVGFAGLRPVLAAIEGGSRIALANKETLVVAGALVTASAERNGSEIIPVDSEHSAIFQCLCGEDPESIKRLVLTASGGPFRERDPSSFASITKSEALSHPNWDMGAKISVDSATMMNKGLEVIEARWLFDLPAEKIDVLVHPQSIIHSMIDFVDGSTKAQLGVPDMRVPIQYALTYPDRWESKIPHVDWTQYPSLSFDTAAAERFPCLGLAYSALRRGGSATAALNAANEAAVDLFLKDQIRFVDIPIRVEYAMSKATFDQSPGLDALDAIDSEARILVLEHTSAAAH